MFFRNAGIPTLDAGFGPTNDQRGGVPVCADVGNTLERAVAARVIANAELLPGRHTPNSSHWHVLTVQRRREQMLGQT